jgi:hypothetical protein
MNYNIILNNGEIVEMTPEEAKYVNFISELIEDNPDETDIPIPLSKLNP